MTAPAYDAITAGLYTGEDYSRAGDTIRRLTHCHEYRIASEVSDRPGRAVAAARLVVDLVETATVAELRAMVVQLTTPELRPAVPVVLGPQSVPAGSANPSTNGVGGLAAPAPPAPHVQLYKAVRTPVRELYCVDSGRAVKVEGDRCLAHGAAPNMCKTAGRAPRCTHQVVSANHPTPVCSECGAHLVLVTAEEMEQQFRGSKDFRGDGW